MAKKAVPACLPVSIPDIDTLIGTAQFLNDIGNARQHTWSVGTRYDVARNVALKVQLDRMNVRGF